MISRSKARHVKRFLYEDSEEDSDQPPEYVYFILFYWCYLIVYWFHLIGILLFGLN